jgi:hypothetical protein
MHQDTSDATWGPDCDAWDNTCGIENKLENVGIQYYYDGVYYPRGDIITDSFAIRYTTDPKGVFPKFPQGSPAHAGANIQSREGPTTTLPVQTMMSTPHPNPFTRHITIAYQIARASAIDLQVYDATGRLVRSFVEGMRNPGYYSEIWDGRDEVGRKVSAGIYFVRFETEDYTKSDKIILLR